MKQITQAGTKLILEIRYIGETEVDRVVCEYFGQGVECPDFFVYGDSNQELPTGMINLGLIKSVTVSKVNGPKVKKFIE